MAIEVNATDFGKALLVKALNNTCPILFTCMKFGNGIAPEDYSEMIELVNPLVTSPLTGLSKGDNYVQISANLSNSDVEDDFSLTEIGVFAMDQDGVSIIPSVSGSGISAASVNHGVFIARVGGSGGTYTFSYRNDLEWVIHGEIDGHGTITPVNLDDYGIEVTGTAASGDEIVVVVTIGPENLGMHLFAYVNQSEDPEVIYGRDSNKLKENAFSVVIIVDDAENVTATVKSLTYVTLAQFEDHIHDYNNPHRVTAAQVGLGNVDNVSTNDQTPTFTRAANLVDLVSGETLKVLMGKIAKAVNSLIDHLKNKSNPHAVTAEQVGAAEVAHTHAATDITSGKLSVARGGTGMSTWTQNGIVFAGNTTVLAQVSPPTELSFLVQNANGAPYFRAFDSLPIFSYGVNPPDNTNLLWIDSTSITGGLKFYNGSSWEHVPVGYSE